MVIGGGNCPFGPLQRSLGDPVPMFELVLLPKAAKAAAFSVIEVILLAAPPWRGPRSHCARLGSTLGGWIG